MAVHSSLPWPLRWALVATVLGFCASIGLWAFEFGRDIAGLDGGRTDEFKQLRADANQLKDQIDALREERDKAVSMANTASMMLTAEKASQDKLSQQIRQLEDQNRSLRDDLGFFEKLIPSAAGDQMAIRALQAEVLRDRLKWQVLVIQPNKNATEFNGQIEITLSGYLAGKPWNSNVAEGSKSVRFKQYARLEGFIDLPAQVEVKTATARVLDGSLIKASQSINLKLVN
jgi:cell division protein FtsB